MTIVSIVPAIAALFGLLLWLLASNSKASEIGKIFFFCGVLVTLFVLANHVVKIG